MRIKAEIILQPTIEKEIEIPDTLAKQYAKAKTIQEEDEIYDKIMDFIEAYCIKNINDFGCVLGWEED